MAGITPWLLGYLSRLRPNPSHRAASVDKEIHPAETTGMAYRVNHGRSTRPWHLRGELKSKLGFVLRYPKGSMRAPFAIVAAALLGFSLPAGVSVAQTAIESQRVTFQPGADSTLINGGFKGDRTIDYKLRAGAGQALTVDLKGSNPQNYFNVLAACTIRLCSSAAAPVTTSVGLCPAMAMSG